MQVDDVKTLVLPTTTAALCITGAEESGAEIAAGLRELASRIEGLSGEELLKYRAASVLHQLNGRYFIETGGRFVTLCWTGDSDNYTIVDIGGTITEATQAIEKDEGDLGGGLVACDEWDVALGHAIESARRAIDL